jgi:hypothetical protein
LPKAVGVTIEDHHLAVVEDAVQDGAGRGDIGQEVGPLLDSQFEVTTRLRVS